MATSIRLEEEPMALERLSGMDGDLAAAEAGEALDVFDAGVVRLGPDLRDVTAVSGELFVQVIRDVDVEVRVELRVVPAQLRLMVAEDEPHERLVRREVGPAGRIDR